MLLSSEISQLREDARAAGYRGIVHHREFLGNLIRYSVAVGENMILVDDSHQRGEPAFAEGAEVSLSLASEQVVLPSE